MSQKESWITKIKELGILSFDNVWPHGKDCFEEGSTWEKVATIQRKFSNFVLNDILPT